jgi:hypothetical protein
MVPNGATPIKTILAVSLSDLNTSLFFFLLGIPIPDFRHADHPD